MSKNYLTVFRRVHIFLCILSGAISVKAIEHSINPPGMVLLNWPSASPLTPYYNAIFIFIFSIIMFYRDRERRNWYIMAMGFSFSLSIVFHFQLLGVLLIVLGILFELLKEKRNSESKI
ncbi:hypothetical protein JMG10_11515 [Nostoc ellipsosporum NOK]|nr:hypothetical protein [Nostoc ellipsosporum NOK]